MLEKSGAGSLLMRIPKLFMYFFWRARVCWQLLCLCRPFFVFVRCCLVSNSESYRSKRPHYQLIHPYPYRHLFPFRIITYFLCIGFPTDFLYTFSWRVWVCWPFLCLCRPFFVFLRNVRIRNQRAAVASSRITNLTSQLPVNCNHPFSYSHPSPFE